MSKSKSFFIVGVFTIVLLFGVYFMRMVTYPIAYQDTFKMYSEEYGVPCAVALAVAKCESDFEVNAVSKAGAVGVMQLMPETAKYIATKISYNNEINLYDYKVNIMLGCAYLSYLYNKFGDFKQVIMAYNAGEGRVTEWLKTDPKLNTKPYSETKIYYEKVKFAKFIYENIV